MVCQKTEDPTGSGKNVAIFTIFAKFLSPLMLWPKMSFLENFIELPFHPLIFMFGGLLYEYHVFWYLSLASIIFCSLLTRNFVIYSLIFWGFFADLRDLWVSCLSCQQTFLLMYMLLFYPWNNRMRLKFSFKSIVIL